MVCAMIVTGRLTVDFILLANVPSSLRTDCLITLYRVVYTSLFSPRKSTNKRITFPLFAVEIMRILLPHNCGYLTNNKTPYQVGILPPQFAICIKNEPFICRCTHFSAYKARWFYAQAVSNNLFTSHPHPCNPRHLSDANSQNLWH